MRILVAGYYGENNLGDEAFQTALPLILGSQQHTYSFVHVNGLLQLPAINEQFDILLVGGGDVVLPYFLEKVSGHFTAGPTILFGAGLTYPSCIALGHLDQFDRVFLRNTSDLREAELRLGIRYVHYVPDLVFALGSVPIPPLISEQNERPRVGFYLIQSIDESAPDSVERQQRVLAQIADCIRHVAQTHNVILVRFNTSGKCNSDDNHICETMMQLCPELTTSGALQYDRGEYRTPDAMLCFMGRCHINVCMRFHSHVFSIVQHVPFVSLSLTRKVHLLMQETGLADTCGVRLTEDVKTLRPLDLPVAQFCERFQYVVANHSLVKCRLAKIHRQRQALLLSGVYEKLLSRCTRRSEPALQQRRDSETQERIATLLQEIAALWQEQLGFDPLCSDKSTLEQTPIESKKRVERRVTAICKKALYNITNQVESAYLWGFVQNMLQSPARLGEYLTWIWHDFATQSAKTARQQKICLNYMRQSEGSMFHRSGWPFVVSHLRSLASDCGVLCDTYVDRTFHWGVDVLAQSAIVPYTQSWIGFVHHTPLVEYSEYNVVKMLRNPVFLASLQTCRGLFVLSNALKVWFDRHLPQQYYQERAIPVRVLIHPTQTPGCGACFSLEAFLANRDRKLIHIGAWLRDTFALYDVGVLDNADRAIQHAKRRRSGKAHCSDNWLQSVGYICVGRLKRRLRRCILRGRDMNLYLPPSAVCIDDCETICDAPDTSVNDSSNSVASGADGMCRIDATGGGGGGGGGGNGNVDCFDTMCRLTLAGTSLSKMAAETRLTNKWIEGLRQHVNNTVQASVDVLEHLSNEEYDRLLSENIVFLCLQDASACNTVIECVVRNTPLLINRLPAVEEMLGAEYPFYYDSLAEALLKSRDYALIEQTHAYLCALDKRRFEIDYFLAEFMASDIYTTL